MDGEPLSDKHMDGSTLVLAKQFPDMPSPQTALRAQRLDKLQPAKENSFFFHNYSSHWALSHLREGVVFLYDSLQPKSLHPDQMRALYGNRKVKAPQVQIQKGSIDYGCFAIAFCVSLLYGDDPATVVYEQKKMREHITMCLSDKYFTPLPGALKKAKRQSAPNEHNLA